MATPASDPRSGTRVPARRRRRWPAVLLGLVTAMLVTVSAAATTVVVQARAYDTRPTDAIVVLGASQYQGTPSPVLANRLDYAATLYRQGVAPVIVTVGAGQPGDRTTEAEAGAVYLTGQGIPTQSVVAIPRGHDTLESLEAVAVRADREGWRSITVVSDRAHLARSAAILTAEGFRVHTSGPASGDGAKLTVEYVARESLGLLRFWLWDRWRLES